MEILKSEPVTLSTIQESSINSESNPEMVPQAFSDESHVPTRSPSDTNVDRIFAEFHSGLTDKNWETRNQTLISLMKLVPNIELVSHSKIKKEIFRLVTLNLGNSVSYVRRNALEAVLTFVKFSEDPESELKAMITHGVDTTANDTNLSLNTIQDIPIVLKTVQDRSTTKTISHQLLAQIIVSLSKRMVQITHQKQVVASLLSIKSLIGESMFDHFLETYYPQVKRDFDVLCNVYDNDLYSEMSDQSDSQSYTEVMENRFFAGEDNDLDRAPCTVEGADKANYDDYADYANSDDDVIMKVYDEDGNEIRRAARRVTFGGEIIKIRTPDSDATAAITVNGKDKLEVMNDIFVHVSSDESLDSGNEGVPVSEQQNEEANPARPRSSHIPLPIRPALHKPKHPKVMVDGMRQKSDYDILMEIPNYDGESLTSSSDGSDRSKSVFIGRTSSVVEPLRVSVLRNKTLADLARLKISDRLVLENLFKKDDWRFYICALERLSQILCQPQTVQCMASSPDTPGLALLSYIFISLRETKNYRIINSALRTLRSLCQNVQHVAMERNLEFIIPALCSYLGSNYDGTIRLEAADTLKLLMRRFRPQTIIDYLFTEQCFGSKNPKMRENSLQCLMYALLTFPSGDFNLEEITNTLIKDGVQEPKRRVRQALLDTMSILGQFLPRSQFKVDCVDDNSAVFKRALRARLTRRQLPIISPDGLFLYAFQISPVTAFGTDVEWILSGQGSLSDNYNKSKVHTDDMSPLQVQQTWNFYKEKQVQNEEFQNPLSRRGNSEEVLFTNQDFYTLEKTNDYQRYSADWTDSRYSSSYFGTLHTRYPSNLSDTSSYASSYTSEQNFPRLNSISRPVSENKLDKLPWSSKSKQSKLPVRLEPAVQPIPIHYSYSNASASLPILNDRTTKTNYLYDYYEEEPKLNNRSSNWSKKKEKLPNKVKSYDDQNSEKHKNVDNVEKSNFPNSTGESKSDRNINEEKLLNKSKTEEDQEDPADKLTELSTEGRNKNVADENNRNSYKSIFSNDNYKEKSKKFLERKAGVKLKRSLTKEIKMPQSTFSVNPEQLPPFENAKDGISKTLIQFESNEWETVIEALQGVVRLTRHHSKNLSACLHTLVIAVAKEIRSLRSQVARAACLSAENIFKYMKDITNQDIEEMSNALFLRTADTNKFLREDSNKALDAMISTTKFSKSVVILTQKVASHPNALIRASAARLLHKLIQDHGPMKVLSLTKDKKESVLNTSVKFLMDGNLETRAHGKNIFSILLKDRRMYAVLSEIVPTSVMATINKFLSRTGTIKCK